VAAGRITRLQQARVQWCIQGHLEPISFGPSSLRSAANGATFDTNSTNVIFRITLHRRQITIIRGGTLTLSGTNTSSGGRRSRQAARR